MAVLQLRIAGAALFLILIVASGVWLGISGKPYHGAILNIHKWISLAALASFGITAYQIGKTGLTTTQFTLVVVAGVLFFGAIVSGGMSSINTMPKVLVRVHQTTFSAAVLSCALALYLLLRAS
jgi:hypothetical protein